MSALVEYAVLACMAAGIGSAAVVLLVSRNAVLALHVGLDLWLAASLLRIAQPPVGENLLYAAAILVIRQLIRVALIASWSRPRPVDSPAPPRSSVP
ncbi:hypothetical protein [Salinispora tropica]|uniref:hypothetical protein n=1 Tax=Salinispora tropica TaxID=168695 RepID=UPI000309D6A2|nr:hypothetical protein [Salinispora tropica]